MKIYFLSSQPCSLRLNGVFFGTTDNFERFAEIPLQDNIFAEFLPENALPVTCFLSEELRFRPPDGCEVYLLVDGIALYARDFPPKDFALRPIAQKRDGDCLATVFSQGHIQLSLQTQENVFIATLPPSFSECALSFHCGLLFVEGKNRLAVYTKNAQLLLSEEVLSYSVEENVLRARLPLSDSLRRFADCAWQLSPESCIRIEFTLRQQGEECTQQDLLPYAFFESVLIGADYSAFLCTELQGEAAKLRSFLGDFESVLPTDNPQVCGLVKKKAERLFEVVYYTVQTENGKITDVTT